MIQPFLDIRFGTSGARVWANLSTNLLGNAVLRFFQIETLGTLGWSFELMYCKRLEIRGKSVGTHKV